MPFFSSRFNALDSLLVFASMTVILLTFGGTQPARQLVEVQPPGGIARCYSLAVDDPRIQELKDTQRKRLIPPRSAELAVANWQAELANLYADSLSAQARRQAVDGTEKIVQVSFSDQSSTPDASPAGETYWRALEKQALDRARTEQAHIESQHQQSLLGLPKIRFGHVLKPAPSSHDFWMAGLGGLLTALLYMLARTIFPPIRCGSSAMVSSKPLVDHDDQTETLIPIEIPRGWIGINQPVAVKLQQTFCLTIAMAALGCLIFF